MTWFAGTLTIPEGMVEAWLQLGLLFALVLLVLRMRAVAFTVVAITLAPFAMASLRTILADRGREIWEFVYPMAPWYAWSVLAFFSVFIALRLLIMSFLGRDIAERTVSDLLTRTIAGVLGLCAAALRFVLDLLMRVIGR